MPHPAALAASLILGLSPVAPAPAPEIAVVVAGDGMNDFAEGVLTRIAPDDGGGLFRRAPAALGAADFEACGGPGVAAEPCIRAVLAARDAAAPGAPPTVVVWLRPGPGFLTGWICVGVGEGPAIADRQTVSLDWSPGHEAANAATAARCILAAAAESGW